MKNKFYSLILVLLALFIGLNFQTAVAYQTPVESELPMTKVSADSIFQTADVLFESFSADAIYKALKDLMKLPESLNFWDKPVIDNLGPEFVKAMKAGVKAYQDPMFLEKSVGEAYKTSQDPAASGNKMLQTYTVQFPTPNTIVMEGSFNAAVNGNKMVVTSPEGQPMFDFEYLADSDNENVLFLNIVAYEEGKEPVKKNFEFIVTDNGFNFVSEEELITSLVIDGYNIRLDIPEQNNSIELTLNKANYTISGTIVEMGEKVNDFSVGLNPVEKSIGFTLDGNQIFNAVFDAANQKISVDTGTSVSEFTFEDATKSLMAVLPDLQMVARLRFINETNSLAVDVGQQATQLMEMFTMSVDKAARKIDIMTMGSPLFSATVDSIGRTITMTDPQGNTQVLDEAQVVELLNSTTESTLDGDTSNP